MPGKKTKKAVSKKQAKFLGAVAGGKKAKGLSAKEAKEKLKGVKMSKLPAKAAKKKGKKA